MFEAVENRFPSGLFHGKVKKARPASSKMIKGKKEQVRVSKAFPCTLMKIKESNRIGLTRKLEPGLEPRMRPHDRNASVFYLPDLTHTPHHYVPSTRSPLKTDKGIAALKGA